MPEREKYPAEAGELSDARVEEIRRRLLAWGTHHYREFPWRSGVDGYAGLIAEILLTRTRAENVVPVFAEFMRRFPDPGRLADSSLQEVEAVIRPLGLKWRAPLLHELGKRLVELGGIPSTLPELLGLPGVGPYVAAAFISLHCGDRGVLIDSNVVRWIARLLGRSHDAETRRRRWMLDAADRITPRENARAFNYALLDFTMTVCTPRKPSCPICPLNTGLCEYGSRSRRQNLTGEGEGNT